MDRKFAITLALACTLVAAPLPALGAVATPAASILVAR
jgi:hypothetical protein